jgi:predicted Zn-dependent protease
MLAKAVAGARSGTTIGRSAPHGLDQTLLLRDWTGAEKEHREALRLNPKSEDNLYAYASFLTIVGRTNEAIQQVEKALQLDSRSFVWMQNAAFVFLAARQYDRTIRILEDLVEQQPARRSYLTMRFLAPAYRGKGDYLKAHGW